MDSPYIESLHADRFYGSSVVLYKRPSKRVKLKLTYTRLLFNRYLISKQNKYPKENFTGTRDIFMIFRCVTQITKVLIFIKERSYMGLFLIAY